MKRPFLLLTILLWPFSGHAGPITASRILPAGTIIRPADLVQDNDSSDADALIGLQTRVTIYAGRPISSTQLRAARLVERNQVVPLIYDQGGLRIEISGRALAEGSLGDVIPVMNSASRQTVNARVKADGTLQVTR